MPGQAHEGSSYNSQKLLQMTWHRLQHIKTETAELDRHKNLYNHRLGQPPPPSLSTAPHHHTAQHQQQQQQHSHQS